MARGRRPWRTMPAGSPPEPPGVRVKGLTGGRAPGTRGGGGARPAGGGAVHHRQRRPRHPALPGTGAMLGQADGARDDRRFGASLDRPECAWLPVLFDRIFLGRCGISDESSQNAALGSSFPARLARQRALEFVNMDRAGQVDPPAAGSRGPCLVLGACHPGHESGARVQMREGCR